MQCLVWFYLLGFYDISDENLPTHEPDFKRLRQDTLDGKMRNEIEQVKNLHFWSVWHMGGFLNSHKLFVLRKASEWGWIKDF